MQATPIAMIFAATVAWSSLSAAQTPDQCSGHQGLPKPRPEGSCLTLRPQVFPSPDKALRAIVFPVGMDLHATPDMESRVVIRANAAELVTSKDHSSPRGTNGYYVVQAKWSPDSQFFVYTTMSSGGHSPWQFPAFVFSRAKGVIVSLNDLIGGPTTSEKFTFTGPHTLTAETWAKEGSDDRIQIVVDLPDVTRKIVQ